MENQVKYLSEYLLNNKEESLADISYTLQQKREHFSYRRFIVANNYDELQKQLQQDKAPKNQAKFANDKNKNSITCFYVSWCWRSIY